jgi:tetratricopeptide (TPR) repeat protein
MKLLPRVALCVTLLSSGCDEKTHDAPAADLVAGVVPPPVAAAQYRSPKSTSQLRTTDGSIALGNMEGDIANVNKMIQTAPNNVGAMVRLSGIYLFHGNVTGRLDEYDQAIELTEKAVKIAPNDPAAWIAHAEARSRMHLFDEARADLDRAASLKGDPRQLEAMRASIQQALGRYGEARPAREKAVKEYANFEHLSAMAGLVADEGNFDEAERLYLEAQDKFADVAAYPLAWLYFQEGLLWERAGKLPHARELYEASVERWPGYAPATGHLAGLLAATGDRARAVELLRALVEKSNDPEYQGQLAGLLRAEGHTTDADLLRDKARARYDELLKKHPAAFGDHAARFFLAEGADPARALALAQANVKLRQTGEAFELLIEAAVAAKAGPVGCEAAEKALAACAPPTVCTPHRHVLASRAFDGCGKKDRAEAELKAAGGK